MVDVDAGELRAYLAQVFVAMGVAAPDAGLVAGSYVTAELNGLASHGVMRIPRIVVGIDAGTHFPERGASLVREGPAFAVLDGQSALGVVVGITAMRTAMAKARTVGVGCVTVFNSNHFGTAGFYCHMAAEQNMIGMTVCNGSPGVTAPAGQRPVIGPNPVAIGAPTRSRPIVLDMSIAAIVRGRALEHQRRGQALPAGVALGPDHHPTVDPTEALAGSFLPFGGAQSYKAFGLGVMIDVLSGPLAGAGYGDKVRGSADTTQDCNKGDFYLAIDVGQFRELDDYLDDVEDLADLIRGSGEQVYLPGEIEDRRSAAGGGVISLDDDMAAQLSRVGERFGVQPPSALRDS